MIVKILDVAEREFDEAVSWYRARRIGLEESFVQEFIRATSRIRAFPNAWPRISKRSRRCRLTRFPYAVVYQVSKDAILIIAVAHLHRRPRYWQSRETK